MPIVLRHVVGAESTADYAMSRDIAPAVTFGHGVIDAADISEAMSALQRGLKKM
jgi:GntR family transcriptional regulator/MocR family aminotransferase